MGDLKKILILFCLIYCQAKGLLFNQSSYIRTVKTHLDIFGFFLMWMLKLAKAFFISGTVGKVSL